VKGTHIPKAATNSEKKSLYRPELDVVRLLAFLFVFVHHILPRNPFVSPTLSPRLVYVYISISNAAGFGLCLFFTLSAFLISDLLLRERGLTGTVRIRAFYWRRILRIWPLYVLGLVIGIIYAVVTRQHEAARLLAYLFMIGNWYLGSTGWLDNPMQPLWSISVEEQFYLFWPAVARWFSRRAMCFLALTMIAVANGWLLYYGHIGADVDRTIWTNSFVQFQMFAAGILLALVLKQELPKIRGPVRVLLFLMGPTAWFAAVYVFKAKQPGGPVLGSDLVAGYALGALGSASILLSLLGLSRDLIPRWAAYLGRISYGLYVFHELAFLIARHVPFPGGYAYKEQRALQLILTVALAALSYRYFETPFLRLKARSEVISTQPV